MEFYPAPEPAFGIPPILLLLIIINIVVMGGIVLTIVLLRRRRSTPPAASSVNSASRAERTSLLRERRDRYRQERTRILGMVDGGQISASEAAKLLDCVERETTTMACPFCGEDIRVEALKCHHCGNYLVEEDRRPRRLSRSSDKMIAGVCAGFAEYAGMDTSLVRVLVALAIFFSGIITGLIIYLVAALIMPATETA